MSTAENPVRDRTKLTIFLIVFADLIGFGIVMPLLPSFGARYVANEALIGLLVAATPAMHLLSAPLWGRLSDRIGRRPVMLISLAGAFLSYLLFALAGSYWALLVSRIVAGSIDASVGVGQAWLADRTKPEERAKAMGLIGAAYGMGFIVGPALAGISSHFGESLPGVLAASITGANLVVAFFVLPGGQAVGRSGGQEMVAAASVPQSRPAERWIPLAVAFCVTLGFTVLYVLLSLFAERDLGYDRPRISGLFVVLGVVTAIVQGGLVGRIAKLVEERTLIVLGASILGVGLGALTGASHLQLPSGPTATVLVIALAITGIGWGLVGPGIAGYVSRHTAPERQGEALGLLHGVGAAARIVGPPGFGLLASFGSFVPPFCVAAGVAGLGAIVALFAPARGRSGAGA
jgi:DHA1 family tetracycline resistance protein-like MFS transporter